jgi:hypothetical protein
MSLPFRMIVQAPQKLVSQGAAKARVATDVCARKAEFFAYEFDQQGAWLDVSLVPGTVDREVDEDELCIFRHNGALP